MCDKIHGKHGLIVMHMLFLEWDESEPLEFNARSFDLPCWLTKNSASTVANLVLNPQKMHYFDCSLLN